jgi:ubiquinone/menaquinone biosynthesis C-methylase UbiE
MRSSTTPDFGPLAERYDELRPGQEWLYDTLARMGDLRGRRVLDIGCGTGRLAAALAGRYACKVWGVDPSAEMIEVARRRAPRGVGFKLGRAEALPFRDGWFERATMTLVSHLVDRPVAFAEARRVLRADGVLVLATFEPSHFEGYYLNDLFPSIRRIDLERFRPVEELERELRRAGFASVGTELAGRDLSMTRADALEKIRGRHISTFQLIPEDEYADGLARAERELTGRIDYRLEMLVLAARL